MIACNAGCFCHHFPGVKSSSSFGHLGRRALDSLEVRNKQLDASAGTYSAALASRLSFLPMEHVMEEPKTGFVSHMAARIGRS